MHAQTTLAVAEIYLDIASGWADLELVLRRAKAAGLSEDLIRILINFVETTRDLKRYHEAERYAAEATAVLREREFELYRHLLDVRVAQIALTRGRWEEAERGAKALLGGSSPLEPGPRPRAGACWAGSEARRGAPGAWVMLDEAQTIVGRGELQDICPLHAARAEVAWLEGDLDRAGAEAVAGMELAASIGSPAWYGELSFLAWRAGRIERLPDGTDAAYVLHAAGRFREASQIWRGLGCSYDEALALADSDDEPHLRDALTILHGLGASVMARRGGSDSVPGRPKRAPRPTTQHEGQPGRPVRSRVGDPGAHPRRCAQRGDRRATRPVAKDRRSPRVGDPAKAGRSRPGVRRPRGRPVGPPRWGAADANLGVRLRRTRSILRSSIK